jgi:hypothetical protein
MMVRIGSPLVLVQHLVGTCHVEKAVNSRCTAGFRVRHPSATRYTKGQPFEVLTGKGKRILAGYLDTIRRTAIPGTDTVHSEITGKDYTYLANKRVIGKAYANTKAGDIARDIRTNILAAEGVTVGTIEDGPVISLQVFNYVKCDAALTAVADRAGFVTYIDDSKQLHFHSPTSKPAPWPAITFRDGLKGTFNFFEEEGNYRNKQYCRGAKDTTSLVHESFPGDGVQRTFPVGYPIIKVPTISVNGAQQTVGIKGVDSNKQWYWNSGESTITQDQAEPLVSVASMIDVYYYGQFPVVATMDNLAEQAALAAIEGTTGIVEEVEDDPSQTSAISAQGLCSDRLSLYVPAQRTLEFDTRKLVDIIDVGQSIPVQIPKYQLAGDAFLVQGMNYVETSILDQVKVTAVTGPSAETYQRSYQRADGNQDTLVQGSQSSSTILVRRFDYAKTWASGENPEPFERIVPDGIITPGSILPSFSDDNVVKYVAWGTGVSAGADRSLGNEIGRQAIAQLTVTAGTINSIGYIGPNFAGTILELAWIGGESATNQPGTGVTLARVAVTITKTFADSLYISRVDTKGY